MGHLPLLPTNRQLEHLQISANNCNIKGLHPSFLQPDIKIDLRNNGITELPREKSKEYLENGGVFHFQKRKSHIALEHNPLSYPPKHIFEKGENAILSYLEKYGNDQVDPNNFSILLIGNQRAGKTSLGLTMAGKIEHASEIKENDRTQAFDVYQTTLGESKATMLDLGGHREYESCLALLGRDQGLYLCILNPSDLHNDESLYTSLWLWVEKVLDGATEPHFLIIVTKMDEIDVGKSSLLGNTRYHGHKVEAYQQKLISYLKRKNKKLKDARQLRVQELQQRIQDNDDALSKPNIDHATKEHLKQKKQVLDRNLNKQMFKNNHLPQFNTDIVTFVSSEENVGFVELEENIKKALSNLPKIKLQQHWMETVEILLTTNHHTPYVKFSDLLNATDLTESDLSEMLTALCAMGRIVWANSPNRREIIFHQLDELSFMMKSIFYHEMETVIKMFAEQKQILSPEPLLEKYEQGQLPTELISSMFKHVIKHAVDLKKRVTIDYKDINIHEMEKGETPILLSFLNTLEELKMIMVLESKVGEMEMCFIPHLIFKKIDPLKKLSWALEQCKEEAVYELGVEFGFETVLCKNRFSQFCIYLTKIMTSLASVLNSRMICEAREGVMILSVDHFVAVLLSETFYAEKDQLLVVVRQTKEGILPDTVWILLNEICNQLSTNGDKCRLVCPFEASKDECDHGDYDTYPQSAARGRIDGRLKRIRCKNNIGPNFYFPSQFGFHLIHTKKLLQKVFDNVSSKTVIHLEAECLAQLIFKDPVDGTDQDQVRDMLMGLPFMQHGFLRLYDSVQSVRQHIDNFSSCQQEEHGAGCACVPTICIDFCHSLEKNGLLVSDGDWKPKMREILEKFPNYKPKEGCDGENRSIAAMVRLVRNFLAHKDPLDHDNMICFRIMEQFEWLVMHCYTALFLHIRTSDPFLTRLAEAFQQKEILAVEEGLKNGSLSRPQVAMFVVQICYRNGMEKATFFFMDPKREVEGILKEAQKLVIPNRHKVVFKGIYQPNAYTDPSAEVRLDSSKLLSDMVKDTLQTYSVGVIEEQIRISVKYQNEGTESTMELKMWSDDQFKEVIAKLEEETEEKDWYLFCNNNLIKENATVGSVCAEDYELTALDEVAKRNFNRERAK